MCQWCPDVTLLVGEDAALRCGNAGKIPMVAKRQREGGHPHVTLVLGMSLLGLKVLNGQNAALGLLSVLR